MIGLVELIFIIAPLAVDDELVQIHSHFEIEVVDIDSADFVHRLFALPLTPLANEEYLFPAMGPIKLCDVASAY